MVRWGERVLGSQQLQGCWLVPSQGAGTPQCDSHEQGTATLEHLHSYNIFNVEVFQGSGVGVLPFVTLDDDLLHDPVEQQPVLDSVATSFICREGRGETDVSKGEVIALPGRRAGLPSLQQALGLFPGPCWDSQGIWRQWCRMDIKCGYASLCVSLFLVSSNICVALLVSMCTCGQQPGKVRPLHPQQHHLFPKSQLQTPRVTPTPKLTDRPDPLPCEGQTELLGSQRTKGLKQALGHMWQKSKTTGKTSNLHWFYPEDHSLFQGTLVIFQTMTSSACISSICTHQLKSFGKLQFIFISKHFEEI